MGRKTLWLLGAALLLLPTATAQQDGCTESAPCPWEVTVDESGFSTADPDFSFNATAGDWFTLDLFNLDLDQEHTVTLEGHGLSWTVGPLEDVQSAPFQLPRAGTFRFVDAPTGDTLPVQVFTGDVVDVEANATAEPTPSSDRSVPAPAVPVTLALLAAVALRRR